MGGLFVGAMIRQKIYIDKYDWTAYVYYAVDQYYTDEITDLLCEIGCHGDNLLDAAQNLSESKLDSGLTYSNFAMRETVMVIALTSSAKEFAKSWRHEMGHMACHIAQAYGVDPYGEELQYIGDAIVEEMWKVAKNFLCECCRKKKL